MTALPYGTHTSKDYASVKALMDDPSTSYWLKQAIRDAAKRDILDALRDAETLHKVLQDRWSNIVYQSANHKM